MISALCCEAFQQSPRRARVLSFFAALICTCISPLALLAAPTITYVQGNYATPQSPQTTVNVTFTGAQTAGNLNVVAVGWNDSTATVATVTDKSGNTYTRAVGPTLQNGVATQSIYYAKNITAAAAGSNAVTVTFSTAAAYPDVRILEYSGADPVNPVDVTAANSGNSGTSSSGAVTTTNATDLLFGANLVQTFTTGAGSSFTKRLLTQPDGDIAEDHMVTSTGSYSGTAPLSSGQWIMQMVAFRAFVGTSPTIVSVSPSTGSTAGGTSVTITGTNFATGAAVTFGSAAATNVVVLNSTTITVTTPAASAGAVTVTVTLNGQSGSLVNGFTYVAPPTLSGVSPNTGTTSGGTLVTITGTNFATGASVVFGSTAATNVTVVNGTTITATTPASSAGAVAVTVTVKGVSGSLANGYTYAVIPTVTSVSPNNGSTAGGTSVTITGTNFAAGATVTFGSAAATNVVVSSSTSITATTPAVGAGAVTVTVTVNGQSGNLTNGFTYVAPPTVTGISPNTGTTAGGTSVTISGTNFATGATVMFGSTSATNVSVVNSTTINATTPAGTTGAVTVTVTVNGLSGSLSSAFTYVLAPTVNAVSPNSGPTAGGTSVTLTGANFASGATVTFGSSAATNVTVVNSTTITAATPAGNAGAVTVTVSVNGQNGSLTNGFTYVTPPTVTGLSPNTGTTTGGTSVTINGTNFAAGATVVFGTTSATNVSVVNGTTITATTPAGTAGAVTVTVTVNGLSGSLSSAFTYVVAPTVSTVSPNSGPTTGGTSVTLTGTNFASGATVTVGNSAATNVTVVNSTTITATTPAGNAGAVNVAVNVNGQNGSLTNGFTYIGLPTVTSINPNSGSTAGGTSVTVSGTNFATGATVTLGGTAATNVVVVNSTTITATTPAAAAGAVTVAVTNPGSQTGSLVNSYTYVTASTPTAPGGLAAVGGPAPVVSTVQGYINSTFLTSHTTAPFDSSGGDLIVLLASSHAGVTFTPSDSFSNTWIPIAGPTNTAVGFDLRTVMWYARNPIVGPGQTVTMGLSAAQSLVMSVFVVKGANISSPLEAISLIGSDNGTQSTSVTSPTITTTSANDLLIGFVKVSAGASFTSGTGFTQQPAASSNFLDAESGMAATPGNYAATFTISSTQTWQSAVVAASPDTNQDMLSWTPSTENGGTINMYLVERCQGAGCGSFSQIGTTAGTTFNDIGLSPSTTYSYRVRAQDTANNVGPYSNVFTFTTPAMIPALPSNLAATPSSGQGINLNWVASAENGGTIASYSVERCAGVGCTNFAQVGAAVGTTYNDAGLTGGTTYTYRVHAFDAQGNPSPYSNVAIATTLSPGGTITYVQGNYATPQSPQTTMSVTFTGAQVAGDLNVVVVGWNDSTSTVSSVTDSSGNTYSRAVGPTVQSGLASQSIYYAPAVKAAAAGTNLVTVTFSPAAAYPDIRIIEYAGADPNIPVDVFTASSGSGTVSSSGAVNTTYPSDLLFGANLVQTLTSGAGAGFTSRLLTTPDGDIAEDQMVAATGSYSATAPLSSGQWIMQLVAFRSVSDTQAPTAPTNLTAAAASATQVNLNWTDATDNVGIADYYIERCQGSGCTNFAQVGAFQRTNFVDPGVIANTTYNYRVRATDFAGNVGPYSSVATVTTPPPDTTPPTAPSSLTATAAGQTQVNLIWTASTDNVGVTNYLLERCQGSGCSNFVQVGTIAVTSYVDSPLTAGTTYSYRVRATDAAGNLSGYSNTATATTAISTSFTVTPKAVALNFTATQQFTANNGGVTWAVDGMAGGSASSGTITAAGFYTPPGSVGTHTVTATDSSNRQASATVYITNYGGTLTFHNDSLRTGQNSNETVLTTSNVNQSQFGKLFAYSLDGIAYSSPLYVPSVSIPGKGIRNVVYIATEHDSVYAFDADGLSTTPLWTVSFLQNGATTVPCADVNECGDIPNEIGITGTPVIDSSTGTLYVVAKTKEGTTYVQRLHALDITTGAEKFGGPATLQASLPGTPNEGGATVVFSPLRENQRPGLLLLNGVIYMAFGSHGDNTPWHGWVLGYNASTLKQTMAYCATPNGNGAGIWQSGGGLATDANGNIFLTAGNGTFDANNGGADYAESVVKLSPSGTVLDYFTPHDQQHMSDTNIEMGSAGPVLLLDQPNTSHPHLLITAGKTGTIYVVDRDNLGKYSPTGDQNVESVVGVLLNSDQEHGNYSAPAYFNGYIYFAAANDTLKAFQMTNGVLASAPASQSVVSYPNRGGSFAISANGTSNGVLWAMQDNNPNPGVLRAYDANNLSSELYDSSQAGARDALTDSAAKFNIPLVANGKVFVVTLGSITAYGLLP